MSFKTILTIVGALQPEHDLEVAADVCEQVNAHLSALVVASAPQPGGRYSSLTAEWVEERERNLQALATRVSETRDLLARRKLSFDVDGLYAEIAEVAYDIGERAIYCDLLLVGPDVFENDDLKGQVLGGGLFQSGRPVLLVPRGTRPTLQPKTVVLAWDSRAQSAQAAREALQLMTRASHVHVTMVDPTASLRASGDEPGADVAAYLARHGVNVTVDSLPSGGRTVAQVLQQHAVDVAADVIVMGAYGHSRLRQFIFGGVTRSMVDGARLPVLMAR